MAVLNCMPNPAGGQGSGSALELLLQKKAEKGVALVHLVQGSQVHKHNSPHDQLYSGEYK
jgi:hypothetical protein